MTSKQEERELLILNCIKDYKNQFGYPPTIRDIQSICAISSTSVVHAALNSMADKGLIKRDGKRTRSVVLEDNTVPLMGVIAAGIPISVPENDVWDNTKSVERLEIPSYIKGDNKNVYALKVEGNSMIDAYINDGDIVFIEQTKTLENGEMGVVWLKNENSATLKNVFFEGDKVRLQPANSTMAPIIKDAKNVVIQGKVIGVIRRY